MEGVETASLLATQLDYFYAGILSNVTSLDSELSRELAIYFIKRETEITLDYCIRHLEVHSSWNEEVFTVLTAEDTNLKRLFVNKPYLFYNVVYYYLLTKTILPTRVKLDLKQFFKLAPKLTINNLSTVNDNKLGVIKGIIKSNSGQFPALKIGHYVCKNCKREIRTYHEYNNYIPPVCQRDRTCLRIHLVLDETRSYYTDVVKIDLQQTQDNLQSGQQPRSIVAFSEVNKQITLTPGKLIQVGVVVKRHNIDTKNTPFYQRYLEIFGTLEVEISPVNLQVVLESAKNAVLENPEEFEAQLLEIICPLALPKLIKQAILLQIIGGVQRDTRSAVKVRRDIHILLVGNPGVGKSQILKNAASLAEGVYTNGVSATGVGLTAAVVKDAVLTGKWAVEAGAFVFADNRYLCIDEIDKVPSAQIMGVHEAMQQQSISLAKAGIVMTLNTRCPVLAAANPVHGAFIPETPMAKQIGLPPTILNRFDLVFLLNSSDSETQVLENSIFAGIKPITKEAYQNFKHYIQLCKSYVCTMTKTVERLIAALYKKIKKQSTVLVTARQFECIIRLVEARARACFSELITEAHYEYVEKIVLFALSGQTIDSRELQTTVSKKQFQYRRQIVGLVRDKQSISYKQLLSNFKDTQKFLLDGLLDKLVHLQVLYKPSHNTYALI